MPTPRKKRPSNRQAAVAAAWATMAGWIRIVGHVTPVPTRSSLVRDCYRPEDRPDERALALHVDPGMKVIRDQSEPKPGPFSSDRVSDQVRRTVLFTRQGVTDLHQRSVPRVQASRNLSRRVRRRFELEETD